MSAVTFIKNVLNDYHTNGPAEIGVASGADLIKVASQKLVVQNSLVKTVAESYVATGASEPIVKASKNLAAFLWMDLRFSSKLDVTTGDATDVDPADDEIMAQEMAVHKVDAAGIEHALMLVQGAKITYWQTNHHTGGRRDKLTTYLGKIMTAIGVPNPSEADIEQLWVMAHWVDTRYMLNAIGIRGIVPGAPDGRNARHAYALKPPAGDAKIRINSKPAGTAAWFDVLHVLNMIVSGSYGKTLSRATLTAYHVLDGVCSQIMQNPARYHIGSLYLTGSAQLHPPMLDAALASIAKAACVAIIPNSSLKDANSLSNIAADETMVALWGGVKRGMIEAGQDAASAIASISGSGKDSMLTTEEINAARDAGKSLVIASGQ